VDTRAIADISEMSGELGPQRVGHDLDIVPVVADYQ
jgi:hypothetical protein